MPTGHEVILNRYTGMLDWGSQHIVLHGCHSISMKQSDLSLYPEKALRECKCHNIWHADMVIQIFQPCLAKPLFWPFPWRMFGSRSRTTEHCGNSSHCQWQRIQLRCISVFHNWPQWNPSYLRSVHAMLSRCYRRDQISAPWCISAGLIWPLCIRCTASCLHKSAAFVRFMLKHQSRVHLLWKLPLSLYKLQVSGRVEWWWGWEGGNYLCHAPLLYEFPFFPGSALNRVLEPVIMMEIQLSNGKTHSFEVGMHSVHHMSPQQWLSSWCLHWNLSDDTLMESVIQRRNAKSLGS